MSSRLSAPGSEKLGNSKKRYITLGLFSKTRKRVLLTLRYSEFSRKIRKIFLFQHRVNRTHPKYLIIAGSRRVLKSLVLNLVF